MKLSALLNCGFSEKSKTHYFPTDFGRNEGVVEKEIKIVNPISKGNTNFRLENRAKFV
jgi:hypothetical protein